MASIIVFTSFVLYLATAAYSADVYPGAIQAPTLPHEKALGKKWCVPIPNTADKALQDNIDSVCSKGIDCKPIQPGGACFHPKTVFSHAQYAMNAYYSVNGRNSFNCDFKKTAMLTATNPSYDKCEYA